MGRHRATVPLRPVSPIHDMGPTDAVAIVDAMAAVGVDVCLSGGWSVDALLGRQTRPHQDLDLWLPAGQFVRAVPVFAELGIDRLFPWGDERPWNFVLHDGASRRVDLHMYEPVGEGMFHYGARDGGDRLPLAALAGEGTIDGWPVRCEDPAWCVRFHTGYPPRPEDRNDVPLLCERFGIELPPAFSPHGG